jgi:hypothetical protein
MMIESFQSDTARDQRMLDFGTAALRLIEGTRVTVKAETPGEVDKGDVVGNLVCQCG